MLDSVRVSRSTVARRYHPSAVLSLPLHTTIPQPLVDLAPALPCPCSPSQALLDSLGQALSLAPLFVWLELLFLLGYRPALRSALSARVQASPLRKGAMRCQSAMLQRAQQ